MNDYSQFSAACASADNYRFTRQTAGALCAGATGSDALPATDFLFPLRKDWSVRMWLPRDLTAGEIERLTQALKLCVLGAHPNNPAQTPEGPQAPWVVCNRLVQLSSMKTHQRTIGKKDSWLTPPEILRALGDFDTDPATPRKMPWKTARVMHHEEGDVKPWKGRVWLNPPFNRNHRKKWMRRMADHGDGIMLIPAATETAAFYEYVWARADAVCFMRGRPHFHHEDGTRARANCGCSIALVAYGKENAEILERSNLGLNLKLNIARETTAGET